MLSQPPEFGVSQILPLLKVDVWGTGDIMGDTEVSLGATLCHPMTPGGSIPSLDHPQLCADISLHVSLETRRLLWKPPSSSLLPILFLTLMWRGLSLLPPIPKI